MSRLISEYCYCTAISFMQRCKRRTKITAASIMISYRTDNTRKTRQEAEYFQVVYVELSGVKETKAKHERISTIL
jgi:hypothetical protein